MLEQIHSPPYPWVSLFFWYLIMMRSHTIYWISRGITAGIAHTRQASLLESPVYARAQAWSARWGVLTVPVSLLIVDIQSVIQLPVRVARIPLRRYVTATTAGMTVWATAYTTIGMTVLTAWLTGPTGRLICLLMLIALTLIVVIRRSRVMRTGRGSRRHERV